MSAKVVRYPWSEVIVHVGLVAALAATIQFLYIERPVDYLRVISEDWHGEYATALGFLIFGGCFTALAWRARGFRKCLWGLAALAGVLVGMEELSWGQRILGIATPSALLESNLQGEMNLHNLVDLGMIHLVLGGGLLVWGAVSIVLLRREAVANEGRWLDRWGIPLLPLPLVPWFVLVCYLFIMQPMVKSDELGEFFFGVSVALLGLYSWLRFRTERQGTNQIQQVTSPRQRTFFVAILLAVTLAGAHTLTMIYNGGLGFRIRLAAERGYPHHQMYAQSDKLFEYLYAHPQMMGEGTRLAHARLLRERGEFERAHEVLRAALPELAARNTENPSVAGLNAEAEVLLLMEETAAASLRIEQALKLARETLTELEAKSGDDAARIFWMMAQGMALQKDKATSREFYYWALAVVSSAELERNLDKWARLQAW